MKTLASPCKIVLECYQRQDVSFWPSKRLVTSGFLRIVSAAKYKGINPVVVSSSTSSSTPSLSPGSQVKLEKLETGDQGTYQTRKRVHVKFQIQKECSFGEQFMIVGDGPMLGLWNPSDAIPLQWSDGHVWTVELDVPAEETIQYKFILQGIEGTVSWQPGPDRILKTWDTDGTIFVWEDWENSALQKTTEEEPSAQDGARPEIASEMLIDADISTRRDEDIDSKVGNGSVAANVGPELHYMEEDPTIMNGMSEGMKISQLAAESTRETNGRVPMAAKSSSSMDVEESLITSEGEVVLVPGLSPVLESFNVERSVAFDASLGVKQVMDNHLPEPDEKHESKKYQHQAKTISVMNKMQQFDSGLKQKPVAREQVLHEVLDNDVQRGRTIQSLLNNFGLLLHK